MTGVIQIVKVEEDALGREKIAFDEKAFKKVLKNGNAENKNVAVISICGEYGNGKSLMANFFLQYLKNKGSSSTDFEWLEEMSADSIGCDDPGIFLYQDVFVIDKVAVLIMHIQGKFSVENKNAVFSQMFALGTLLSSVQIINLQTRIQGKDVLFIKKFVDYASQIGAEVRMRGMMNVALKILIRDWPYPGDNPFGYKGGEKFLQYALEASKYDDVDENMFLYQRLKQIFKKVTCFLMPHPGLSIKSRKGSHVKDLDEKFKRCIEEFVVNFLMPDTVEIKQLMTGGENKNMKGLKLLEHAKNCIKEINKQPTSKSSGLPPVPKKRLVPARVAPKKPVRLIKVDTINEHKAVPIIDLQGGQVTLLGDNFETILNQPEIGDKPIALISIAGTFRKGKSFILNFFIRYMRNEGYMKGNDEWMGGENSFMDDGFDWRSGVNPHTQGIMLYTKPFIVDTPNGEVAVLFMDTQGLFDANTGKEKNMMIFAFNTILSSVQILNISMNLQESDLEFLQLFTEYARTLKNERSDKQFLQSIKFLVRDWQYTDDHAHGIKGGEEYLEAYMSTNNRNDELKNVREFISSKYKSISCFLMPHPGFELLKLKNKAQLKDLNPDFREQLTPLVESILHPNNLVVKKFGEKPMSARALYASATKFAESFSKGNLPNLTVMMDVIAEANNNERRKECLDYYTEVMKKNSKSCTTDEEFQRVHENAKIEAIGKFFTGKEFGGAKKQGVAIKHVTEEIDNARSRFLAKRDHTEALVNLEDTSEYLDVAMEYKRLMETLNDQPIDPNEFDEFEANCWKQAKLEKLKGLRNLPKQTLENMEKERNDFASIRREENEKKYNLVVEGLKMPGNYFQLAKQEDQAEDPSKDKEPTTDTPAMLPENVEKVLKKYNDALEKQKYLSVDKKSEILLKYARQQYDESQSKGYFEHYIQLLKDRTTESEPEKIQPNEKVMSNLRLRRIVGRCVKLFEEETKQYSGLFVRKSSLESRLQERKEVAKERFLKNSYKKEASDEDIEKHRRDLMANLEEKIRLIHQENQRDRIHFNNAKEELEKRIVKKYHSNMDGILKSGYIVEAKLKEFHENLVDNLKDELRADELPFYSENKDEDNIFVNFKNDTTRKIERLFQEKKMWNKKNHGVVVRALTNFFYR